MPDPDAEPDDFNPNLQAAVDDIYLGDDPSRLFPPRINVGERVLVVETDGEDGDYNPNLQAALDDPYYGS